MKLYAELPLRRIAQVVADLLAVLLIGLAVWLAVEVRDQVLGLRAPGDRLIDAGSGLRDTFNSAADNADDVPLVGKGLAAALHTGSDAGNRLTQAGQWQIGAVQDLAFWLTVIMIAIPALFLALTWLPARWRFARRATAAARMRDLGEAAHDLLAFRALAHVPLQRLDPAGVGALGRDRDQAAITALAHLELARLGLRPSYRDTSR